MNSNRKKLLSLMIAVSMVASMATPAMGSTTCPKDEVVYINLDHDGAVNDVYVVNSYISDSETAVVDYGDYKGVRNLTTTEKLSVENGEVKINLPKGKFYYQGNLETKEIPWIIDIAYKLDGKDISGEELAGQSGHLEIFLSLKKNPDTNPIYLDNYALQATVSFDSDKSKNIVSENATIANVGNNKHLSYIVLPDKEKDYKIDADVVDFEMDGISINGIPLSLDIDDPDTDELMEDVYDLQDGAVELDDGAIKLDDAVAELCDGVIELHDGADDLKDGVDDLYDATKELKDGADKIDDGFSELGKNSDTLKNGVFESLKMVKEKLTGAGLSVDFTKGSNMDEDIQNLYKANKIAIETALGSKVLSAAVVDGTEVKVDEDASAEKEEVPKETPTAEAEIPENSTKPSVETPEDSTEGIVSDDSETPVEGKTPAEDKPEEIPKTEVNSEDEVEETDDEVKKTDKLGEDKLSAPSLKDSLKLLSNQNEFQFGMYKYISATEKLSSGYSDMHSGIRKLNNGVKELYDGTNDLKDGVDTLFDGSLELKDGTVELTDGTFELRDETWDLDSRVDDEIDEMLDEYRNNEFDPVSFVSGKNINIDSVQFVMKTAEITIDDEEAEEEEAEEELGFWGRVKSLFSFLNKED